VNYFALVLLASTLTAASTVRSDDAAGSTFTFSTGATITLPLAPDKLALENKKMPNGLVSARSFLRDENTILSIEEIALAGKTCEFAIAGEWAQMRTNQANTDPDFRLLFQLNKLERQTVGESIAIYSELDTRIPKEVREGAPYHSTAGYLLCQRDTLVSLMLWLKKGSLDRGLRERLATIANSLRAMPR
jgi:hypothetical protein